MSLGTLTPNTTVDTIAYEGEIITLTLQLNIMLVTNSDKLSERSPDYLVFASRDDGQNARIGGAWKRITKDKKKALYYLLCLDDPSFEHELVMFAFSRADGTYDLKLSRK